ncbi:glycosyltransferase family protein [Cyclobacterium plantarum]|uniref:Glycosyltransferase n=1 Tax=Cyclobacterium plantarum TaxID=2716263 RepID=A0ABX0H915_9BACT|nr:glycosyltransferase family protein [Cyclobacterium plantarum]NHE58164.1 glycosyltransferase [Cyclobacterium plantarum]
MKFLFIVQGEGRGHMTQAMVMEGILRKEGHEVAAVIVGASSRRETPNYFIRAFNCEVHRIQSPNFVTDKANKAIRIGATLLENLKKIRTFSNSLREINRLVQTHQPDCIINFYDMLGGIYNFCYQPSAKCIVVGHQYLSEHQEFIFAKPAGMQKLLFRINTKITAMGAFKSIALSLWEPRQAFSKTNLLVWPPLIKSVVKSACPIPGDFFLIYIVNSGYAKEIFEMARNFPELKIEAFWDDKEMPEKYQPLPNLLFHQVNDLLFIEKLSQCKAYLTTAGFESIAEAMYLNKKVLMVPVKGQYEQKCNALDAERTGAGIAADTFDPLLLEHYLHGKSPDKASTVKFKQWEQTLEFQCTKLMESLMEVDNQELKKSFSLLSPKLKNPISAYSK